MAKTNEIIVPSSPADLKRIMEAVKEGNECMTRIAAEKDALKDIVDTVAEEFKLPKRYIGKLIKTYFKQSFEVELNQTEDFQELYTAVTGVK
jgi:hypothetical protein